MDGWLVLGRCGSDDIPLSLHATEGEARTAAGLVTREQVIAVARESMSINVSVVICSAILPFVGGKAGEIEIAIDLDGEDN